MPRAASEEFPLAQNIKHSVKVTSITVSLFAAVLPLHFSLVLLLSFVFLFDELTDLIQ